MKKDKKIFSYKSMIICSLIVSVVSISYADAAKKGPAGSKMRTAWCLGKMNDCIDDIVDACNGFLMSNIEKKLCESSETIACEGAYGGSSNCGTRPRLIGGSNEQALGEQDAYISPGTNNGGNRNPNTNTLVPQSGFVAQPPPTNNGSTRTPPKSAVPMNKSLVAPLVVPTKKTNTKPTYSQPKMSTMSAPTIQPKQPVTKHRIEKTMKRNVASPESINKNKQLRKQVAPTTSKGVSPKLRQPVMRKMHSAPVVNGSKSKAMPMSKNNFDEADALFVK